MVPCATCFRPDIQDYKISRSDGFRQSGGDYVNSVVNRRLGTGNEAQKVVEYVCDRPCVVGTFDVLAV